MEIHCCTIRHVSAGRARGAVLQDLSWERELTQRGLVPAHWRWVGHPWWGDPGSSCLNALLCILGKDTFISGNKITVWTWTEPLFFRLGVDLNNESQNKNHIPQVSLMHWNFSMVWPDRWHRMKVVFLSQAWGAKCSLRTDYVMMSLPAGQTVQSPPRDNHCRLKCPFTSFCFVFLFDSHPLAWKHQRSPGLQGLNVGEIDPTNADICFFFFFFQSCLFLSLQDQTICRGLWAGHSVGLAPQGSWWRTQIPDMKSFTDKYQIKITRLVEFPFLLHWPIRNEDLSKLQRVLVGSPPPSCPIKVSPLRLLLQTSTKSERKKSSQPVPRDRVLCISFSLS